jgi:hypothetical protein
MERKNWAPGKADLPTAMGPASAPVNLRDLGICPGYLVRLRAVTECVQGKAAFEHGALAQYVPGNEAALLDGIMEAHRAFNLFEFDRMQKAAAK